MSSRSLMLRLAKRRNLRTVLHASPAVSFPIDLVRLVDGAKAAAAAHDTLRRRVALPSSS